MAGEIKITDAATMYIGDATKIFQAKAIRQGLKACKIGMRLNRAYTPTALFRTATNLTGKTFKRGQYDEAISAMDELIHTLLGETTITS